MRTVYIVRGSEDGILGVYSNAPAAVSRAMRYVESPANSTATYLAELRGPTGFVDVTQTRSRISAAIEAHAVETEDFAS